MPIHRRKSLDELKMIKNISKGHNKDYYKKRINVIETQKRTQDQKSRDFDDYLREHMEEYNDKI